jgi:hypothetical protein
VSKHWEWKSRTAVIFANSDFHSPHHKISTLFAELADKPVPQRVEVGL